MKSQTVNILGFEGHMVSVMTAQWCWYGSCHWQNAKAWPDCVPIKLYLHKQARAGFGSQPAVFNPWLKLYDIAISVDQKWPTIGNFI